MTMEASRAGSRLRLLRRPADRAFEQLYAEHAREVYQYALAVLANPADAEDVTQTTFLNAYRAFQRGERPQKPHNWLIAIAHNVCRMRWRAAGSRPREVALEEAPEPVATEHEPAKLDEVLTALAALSFSQRAALVMRELEGRSYQEIADVLGLSTSAVEALLFRARRRLRLDRKSLGAITSVPLPGSLSSFVGGGGGVVAAGSTAVGADVVLKAAAVVAAGAVTAGAGYKGVDIVATAVTAKTPQQYAQAALKQQRQAARNARAAAKHSAVPARPRRTIPGQTQAQPGRSDPGSAPARGTPSTSGIAAPLSTSAAPAVSSVASAVGSVASTAGSVTSAVGSVASGVGSVATAPVASLPPVPAVPLPNVPPAPVPVSPPTVPPLPVTVPTPQLPPAPPVLPPPPLPPIPPK